MPKKKGRTARAAKKNQINPEDEYAKVPHTMVFSRGTIGKVSAQLVKDVRRVFEPFTARKLEFKRQNALKDFVTVAGPLGINYFLVFSKTEIGNYLRVMRLSRGPTMTFAVKTYALTKDVTKSQKKQSTYVGQFLHPPLLVLNNFNGEGLHKKLMATMFQNMFPPIDVNEVQIKNIRRCVLINYNEDTQQIDFRHYSIRAVPVGMSRCAKKLIQSKVPSLANYKDISEFFLNTGYLSESEAELDGEHNEVTLPQKLSGRGNIAKQKSAVRLVEIGPRMTLQLMKIEEGLNEGEVLYHSYIKKSKEEIAELREKVTSQKKLKVHRKKKQEADVKRKKQEKEEHKSKSLQGIAKKQAEESKEGNEKGDDDDDDDDDAEYYRKEVGEEPDPDLFPKKKKERFEGKPGKRKADQTQSGLATKKRKVERKSEPSQDRSKDFNMKFAKGGFQGKGMAFRKSKASTSRVTSFKSGAKGKASSSRVTSFKSGAKGKAFSPHGTSFKSGAKGKGNARHKSSFRKR